MFRHFVQEKKDPDRLMKGLVKLRDGGKLEASELEYLEGFYNTQTDYFLRRCD